MSVAKLELRIDLGPSVVGQTEEAIRKASEHSSAIKQLSPYAIQQKKIRAHTTGARNPRDQSEVEMPDKKEDGAGAAGEEEAKEEARKKRQDKEKPGKRRRRVKVKKEKAATAAPTPDGTPKPILRQKDTPPTGSRVVIKEEEPKTQEANRETPGMTLPTPLRGDANSPLKPYKLRGGRQGLRNTLLRLTTPGTAPVPTRNEERKMQLDAQAGTKALNELLDAIAVGTRMLEFKDMLQVKVNVGIANHIPKVALEGMSTFRQIADELSLLWKVNRLDVELLEYLLNKIGMLDRFVADIEKYKSAVGYAELPASSEREVTTIISSLHNILQGSEESGGSYTTMCFLHYGDVYSFTRPRLSCLKKDLSALLSIHPTQITYIAKVAANGNGYVTVFQMPCSVSRKLVVFAKKNNETLMSLGLKGVQITGSDGLRYTQSLGYLQEKISSGTQTSADDTRVLSRLTKTAPAGSTLPPLGRRQGYQMIRPDLRAKKSAASSRQSRTPHSGGFSGEELLVGATPSPVKEDLSLNVPEDPYEAKFERRIRLVKSTINELSKPETDDLAAVLLEQIRGLHKNISALKKDLREKSRDLNTSQGFVKQAQKEMKQMEMRLETKAQQISQTNEQLIKKIKTLMNENVRLSNALHRMDAELDVHRQLEKESRFGNMIRAVRVTTSEPTAAV